MKRQFSQTRDANQVTVEISAPEGSYRPAKRDLVLELWSEQEPKTVTEQGASSPGTLPKLAPGDLATSARGWAYADGLVTVKDTDGFEAVGFLVGN